MLSILIRTTGGKKSGYGHVYRCLSLAKAITRVEQDTSITFLVNPELIELIEGSGFRCLLSTAFNKDQEAIEQVEPDLIIFDSYTADDDYLKLLRSYAVLLVFDDNNDLYDASIPDVLVNGNIHAKALDYPKDADTRYLLGPEYLVVREDYWNQKQDVTIEKKGILITTGGSDPYHISLEILNKLRNLNIAKKIIIGPGYTDETISEILGLAEQDPTITVVIKPVSLKEHIDSCQYVVTACGGTVYEVLAMGSIPVIFSMADNQNVAYEFFKREGIETIGIYPNIDFNHLRTYLSMAHDQDTEKSSCYKLDGLGALRVAIFLVQSITEKRIKFERDDRDGFTSKKG